MTTLIVLINVVVFIANLHREAFVAKWSVVPADIVAGHHWITMESSQ